MKPSRLLRKAAEYLDGNSDVRLHNNRDRVGACFALTMAAVIANAWGEWPTPLAREYLRLLGPDPLPLGGAGFWWPLDEEHHNVRVLALCFAADIAQSEGL